MALIPKKVVADVIEQFAESAATGAGLNILAQARRMLVNSPDDALAFLKRAASKGRFIGTVDDVEKTALRKLVSGIAPDVKPMANEIFSALQKPAEDVPLLLDASNFPRRMSDMGFIPLTGQNINKPGLTMREFATEAGPRFVDEGAQNLIAAVNLDPDAAAKYAKFYGRTRDQLANTGVPLGNIGGAWATLSAAAEPGWNAELLRRVITDPTTATTSQLNQRDALKFLAGLVDDPTAVLGRGKRYNFMMNSIAPEDPRFLTADTRYAQNLQGFLNTYAKAPFAGLFSPAEKRYAEIYVKPGLEAAKRLAMTPGELQAASWGNWRNIMAGIPEDLPESMFTDLAGVDYNPDTYRRALQVVESVSPEAWKAALKAKGMA